MDAAAQGFSGGQASMPPEGPGGYALRPFHWIVVPQNASESAAGPLR
ncbi:MAG: hypothetical protein KatS3mg077_0358 [Candidatus Binatia bacterium]|nr:MAG: hypothetical protein KatS3mg077_0358 [Candidatus Binatia bacterium]